MFLIPYLLRAVRLRHIFAHHKNYFLEKKSKGKFHFDKREKSVCIRERSLALWFMAIMILLTSLFVVNISTGFAVEAYIPLHSLDECIDQSVRDDVLSMKNWLRT